jgi:Protein of unknown function (DUF3551)
MRTLAAALMAAPLMLVIVTSSAQAQNYPWCLVKSEARSCAYTSLEQCMANRKVGSFCEQNFMAPRGADRPVSGRPRR